MARAVASCPAPCGPVSSRRLRVRGVVGNRLAQRPNRGAVAEQRAIHAPPRVGEEFLRDGQLARELCVPCLELPPQPLQGEVRINPRDDFVTLKGLGDEVDRAHLEPAYLVLGFVQRRQKDDRRLPGFRILLEAPARLVAVDPGITMSSRIRSGCTRRATSMALSPLRVTNSR